MCSISTTKIKTKAMLQLTLISGRGHRSNHRRLTAAGPWFQVGKVPERKKTPESFRCSGVRDSGPRGGLWPTVGAELVLQQWPIVQDQWLATRWEGGAVSLLLHHGRRSRHPSITSVLTRRSSSQQQQQVIRGRILHFLQSQRIGLLKWKFR